jgi:hypothetical protein
MINHTAVEPNPEKSILGSMSLKMVARAKKINPAIKGGKKPVLQNIKVTNTTPAL